MEMLHITIFIIALGILLAMLLILATGVTRVQQISGYIMVFVGISGLAFYTFTYMHGIQFSAMEILSASCHSVYTTILMFTGKNDYSSIAKIAPELLDNTPVMLLFWFAHLSAVFVSASVLLSTLGKKLVQALRLTIFRKKPLYVIYGMDNQTLSLGKDISLKEKGSVLYIGVNLDNSFENTAVSFGAVIKNEKPLNNGDINKKLFKRLGFSATSKRPIFIMAMDQRDAINIAITRRIIDFATEQQLLPEFLHIYLRSQHETDYRELEDFVIGSNNKYSVESFCEAELSARLLMQEAPPFKAMTFNEDGTADCDFSCLILGFGSVGQFALRHVVMNGQFPGSKFSAVVVDKNISDIFGQYTHRFSGMLNEYDIAFHEMDFRSNVFYELLDQIGTNIKYIVICLGDDMESYSAYTDITRYFSRKTALQNGNSQNSAIQPSIVVNVCNKRYVSGARENIHFFDKHSRIFTAKILLHSQLDKMAQAVNLTYDQLFSGVYKSSNLSGSDKNSDRSGSDMHSKLHLNALQLRLQSEMLWHETDYFSRESCRASADFIPAMLEMAHITEDEAKDSEIFEAKLHTFGLLENLAIAEHLRWNAFHYAMGFIPMSFEEVTNRYNQGIKPFQKDMSQLKHACLVGWDELDDLSELINGLQENFYVNGSENNFIVDSKDDLINKAKIHLTTKSENNLVIGLKANSEQKPVDYKEMDRANILNIPRTLNNYLFQIS